ncbi:gliding motility-associated ABC transporter substrate-binding protein GldG [Aquimarina sp. AD1]|uniref:gliding motility-associated ABC transporter substrate-binding protein GldG n=1 Tax=Aquimarina sp. (strain AD1) TaxID=1714848 RepID=UPI000E50DFD6|nr:gliding motility-associated ABC transporter substrate-binding protein GldG [Aquimarina sp. AD1]AXT55776.1 gliding motility-associated ABC transporter substrate-binding protein GldG [Aquimarina sp. AD1]RKN31370.1 gliding motility-associated ABC transporter substrate-binding protein GldG [Aquimarina sp. AD1]
MLAVIRKEINTFFASSVGYLVIGIFLVLNGLFLWVFKGQFNILDSGFADLSPFFLIAPWILLFLIPAITMRSIAEERKQGTLELLITKPLPGWQIVLGKYLGSLLLIIIALIPSLLYVITVHQLGNPIGNIDIGSTIGSYIAILLLCGAYTAIGTFSSSITNNQIVAFLVGVFLCFLFYFGFSGLADYQLLGATDYTIEQIGIQLHYERISQGIIDTRDIVYFISIIGFFVFLTTIILRQYPLKTILKFASFAAIAVIILNIGGNSLYNRFDLTVDNRFTLSEATENLLKEAEVPISIDVLLEGDFPSEFRKLQGETKQILEEFNAINSNIQYVFTNPIEEEEFRKETLEELQRLGLTPMEVSVQESGKTEIETVVPWAIMNYQNRSVKVALVKNTIGATTEERVNNSIQQLEYVFADALKKLIHPKKHKIAVIKGNGQLPDVKIADFVKTLQEYYFVGAFTLDSVASNPEKTLQDLQKFDLVINAKPTKPFSEKEKYVLDQFIMNGGKSLWLVESVGMEIDSLFTPQSQGSAVAFMQDLKLGDALFSYGVRINPVIVNDLYSAPLMLASGQGNDTQFTPHPWFYASLTKNSGNHPIVKNIESVKFEFSNQIDTLKNDLTKTILLTSSERSKLEGIPTEIRLDNIIGQKPDITGYTEGNHNLAVLLEGSFKSAYKDRVKPFKIIDGKDISIETKMVVIADGDVIKNGIRKGRPITLGYDPYLNLQYGNKEFLLNTVNYLLDDSGLTQVRGKEINIAFLNIEKVVATRSFWQIINIVVPLIILGLFGVGFSFLRKRKYQK